MRVTRAVREYVKQMVLAKVADRLKAAEDAKAAAKADRDAKVEKAEKLCKKLCAEAQAKFAKEVKRKLGLTLITDSYGRLSGNVTKGGNVVIIVNVDHNDFAETMTTQNETQTRCNPSAERDEYDRIVNEPDRIKAAADAAADKLLFELELGKVAKGELDRTLKDLEVKL